MVQRNIAGLAILMIVMALGAAGAEEGTTLVFECRDCNVSYSTRAGWAQHEITAHKAGGCLECRVLLGSDVETSAHGIVHHDALRCAACRREFPDHDRAVAHLVAVHGLERCERHDVVFENGIRAAEHARGCTFFRSHRSGGAVEAPGGPAR